jgi:hypothetical protein
MYYSGNAASDGHRGDYPLGIYFEPGETKPSSQFQPTLARFLAKVYDDHLAAYEARRTLFEPRRVATPDGYPSTKCVAAGVYALLTQARLAAEDGEALPTEITASTFCYRILEHRVPIYFVDEEFARAVAATQLPDDFTFGDLNWPQPGMVVGWPPRFLQEYTGREFCYIYAANCPAGSYRPKGLEGAPVIEVPEGRSKIGWFYHAWSNGRPECFTSAYLIKDTLAESITGYTYTDYMGEDAAKVQADKELTERVSALMLKLLVILNMRPSFIAHGAQERPRCIKHARGRRQEIWSATFIGRGHRLARERQGTHASPRIHIRRGHVTWQVIGPRPADGFVSATALPRNDRGSVDWEKVAPETRERFLRCHKRMWLEPVLIGAKD